MTFCLTTKADNHKLSRFYNKKPVYFKSYGDIKVKKGSFLRLNGCRRFKSNKIKGNGEVVLKGKKLIIELPEVIHLKVDAENLLLASQLMVTGNFIFNGKGFITLNNFNLFIASQNFKSIRSKIILNGIGRLFELFTDKIFNNLSAGSKNLLPDYFWLSAFIINGLLLFYNLKPSIAIGFNKFILTIFFIEPPTPPPI